MSDWYRNPQQQTREGEVAPLPPPPRPPTPVVTTPVVGPTVRVPVRERIWTRIGWRPRPGDWLTRNLLLAALAFGLLLIVASCGYGMWILAHQPGNAQDLSTPEPLTDVVEKNGAPAPVQAPTQLEFGGRTWTVYAVMPQGNQWPFARNQPERAPWIRGTLVNYVIGLVPNNQNLDAVGKLQSGDTITLVRADGTELHFAYRDVTEGMSGPEVYNQHEPGLTLVTLQDDLNNRLVVRADYQADQETLPPAGSGTGLAAIGEPVSAGPAEFTVLDASIQTGPPIPAGNGYVQVNYQITNQGQVPLVAANFKLTLSDAQDLQFSPSPAASENGSYGTIEPNASLTATVGFEITLPPTPPLKLSFRPTADSEQVAEVRIPVELPPTATPQPPPSLQVRNVNVDLNRGPEIIVVTGVILNPSQQEVVTVQQTDITLTSPDTGPVALQDSGPPLPWSIAPQQSQPFTLTFVRPGSTTAVLTILSSSFQLAGLR